MHGFKPTNTAEGRQPKRTAFSNNKTKKRERRVSHLSTTNDRPTLPTVFFVEATTQSHPYSLQPHSTAVALHVAPVVHQYIAVHCFLLSIVDLSLLSPYFLYFLVPQKIQSVMVSFRTELRRHPQEQKHLKMKVFFQD